MLSTQTGSGAPGPQHMVFHFTFHLRFFNNKCWGLRQGPSAEQAAVLLLGSGPSHHVIETALSLISFVIHLEGLFGDVKVGYAFLKKKIN